ncbi:sporozoite surface protein 2 [Lingula anatina]|uniref:Sporozoite surface protein 2 n=1 Tax=Lingula anatina TaxID=7574 RepID=A0A1S3I1E7_LINAN|nr:sporozoite surface protein 2 [Lingula anatina]|eukprot:XP_013392085.1 sporozoite surface protein 2 [Lingula anatina]
MVWVLAVAICVVTGVQVQGQLNPHRPTSVQELGFGCLLDMCIAVDSSHSLDSQGFQQELDFLEKLVDFIDGMSGEVKAHYAAVVFSTNVSVHFDFSETRTKEEIKGKLQQIPYIRGRTNIPDAMEQCRMLLQRSPSKRYADIGAYIVTLVLTDGVANEGILTLRQAAGNLRRDQVKTIAVGAGPGVNMTELGVIAQGRLDHVFQADIPRLHELVEAIGATVCAGKKDTCQWSKWGECDAPCGGGIRIRTRGEESPCCDECLRKLDVQSCNRHTCP